MRASRSPLHRARMMCNGSEAVAPNRCSVACKLHRCWACAQAHAGLCIDRRERTAKTRNSEILHKTPECRHPKRRNLSLDAWVSRSIIEPKQRCASVVQYDRQRRSTSGIRRVRASAAAVGTSFATQPCADVGSLRLVLEPDRTRQLSPFAASREGVGDGVRPRAEAAVHDARVHGRRREHRRAQRRASHPVGCSARCGTEGSVDQNLPLVRRQSVIAATERRGRL